MIPVRVIPTLVRCYDSLDRYRFHVTCRFSHVPTSGSSHRLMKTSLNWFLPTFVSILISSLGCNFGMEVVCSSFLLLTRVSPGTPCIKSHKITSRFGVYHAFILYRPLRQALHTPERPLFTSLGWPNLSPNPCTKFSAISLC